LKFLSSQLSYFFANRRTKTNVRKLLKFVSVLVLMYISYGILFHFIAIYEGQDHSWVTGFYWTLVTMSTLGFGDIVFTSDIGRIFSMIVIISGVLFLLILLPFTFIEFFYAPWMKAMNQAKAPKKIADGTRDHLIITELNPVTDALIKKLNANNIEYALLEPDLQKALDLSEEEYNVLNLDPTNFETYENLNIGNAKMVVAAGPDMINTNVTFTVKEFNPDIKVVATSAKPESVDILELSGADHVIQIGQILGNSLSRRTLGGNARVHLIGRIDELLIGEATAQETPLIGKTLQESGLREHTGVTVVGLWERGTFKQPLPDSQITDKSVLVLAGSVQQFRNYDELISVYHVSDKPVVIIGAGRVGKAAAKSLESRQVDYRIIDKDPVMEGDKFIMGDAADHTVLDKAGIRDAHSALITTHSDDINIYLTIYCRQLKPNLQIISRATYDKNINTMHRAGADFVMSYATMGANAIYNILEGKNEMILAEGLNIFTHKVNELLENKSLIETNIRKDTGCTVLAIRCEDRGMIVSPDPNRKLKNGQDLILIGSPDGENQFKSKY